MNKSLNLEGGPTRNYDIYNHHLSVPAAITNHLQLAILSQILPSRQSWQVRACSSLFGCHTIYRRTSPILGALSFSQSLAFPRSVCSSSSALTHHSSSYSPSPAIIAPNTLLVWLASSTQNLRSGVPPLASSSMIGLIMGKASFAVTVSSTPVLFFFPVRQSSALPHQGFPHPAISCCSSLRSILLRRALPSGS
jgi:hypothetical protein